MEYLALVYGSEDTWGQLSEEQRNAAYEGYMAVSRDATAAGALVDASELESTGAATSVRVRNGESLVTDGPYAEVKESLGPLAYAISGLRKLADFQPQYARFAGDGFEYFFHSSGCPQTAFDDLREGQAVTFDIGQGAKGPRGENVRLSA